MKQLIREHYSYFLPAFIESDNKNWVTFVLLDSSVSGTNPVYDKFSFKLLSFQWLVPCFLSWCSQLKEAAGMSTKICHQLVLDPQTELLYTLK